MATPENIPKTCPFNNVPALSASRTRSSLPEKLRLPQIHDCHLEIQFRSTLEYGLANGERL